MEEILATGEERPCPSVVVLLRDAVVAPWEAFRAVATCHGVTWLVPALLVVGTGLIALAIQAPYAAAWARQQMEAQLPSLPPQQAELVRQQAEQFVRPTVVLVSGALTMVVVVALMWLLMAGLLYVLLLFAGFEGTFGQAWSVAIWTNLPFAVRNVVQAVWVYTHQALLHYPGLSRLVATGDVLVDQRNPLVAVLAQVDVPGLWHVLLVYWAWRGAWGASRRQAAILTTVYTLIMLLLPTVPVFLARWLGA